MLVRFKPLLRCPPGAVRRGILATALLLAGGGAAMAQTAAQCDGQNNLGTGTQLQVTQQDGRALVEISRPRSAGRKVDIEYGDELYSFKFGADGRIRAGFALTAATNEVSINMSETAPITCTIAVPNFKKLFRVVLRWRDPVQLDLNVLEPGGRPGETGHVSGNRPNSSLNQGIGQMDVVSLPPAEGATAEISYVVANPSVIPANTTFSYKLEYLTRGQQPDAPYCEDHPLAAPQFDFIVIQNGEVTSKKMSVSRAKCREKLADARRLMPIRQ